MLPDCKSVKTAEKAANPSELHANYSVTAALLNNLKVEE